MPPEPLPWDRNEYFRDRRYEFTGGGGGGGGGPRWRVYGGSRNNNFSPRWAYPSLDFRRPPGHGKHGGWHMYPEDYPYQTPRSVDRFMDDDMFRSPGMRGDGRYGRLYRDNRPSFGHRDWRGHSWEGNHHHSSSANGVGRLHIANEQRSVGDSPMHASHPRSDSCDQFHFKEQVDKTSDANGSGTSQKVDKENVVGSVECNPPKWSRSWSLTSKGSGFSHSSSSKSIGGESSDAKGDMAPKNVTLVQSPSGDQVPCVPSVAPSEEASSRKKARLGWGQGLAKYEKKKCNPQIHCPEDNVNKAGNATPVSNAEPSNSLASNLADKSPKVIGFSDCSSPTTPSSFACSSSPGLDDKAYGKMIDVDGDASNFSVSSIPAPECQPEQSHFSLEKFEMNSITNLGSMLTELLQADDQCSLDTGFMRTSALNKLLLWKGDISKALELTETEIDFLENELSSLKSHIVQMCDDPASSTSGSDGPNDASNVFPRPQPLEVVSNGDIILEGLLCNNIRGIQVDSKDEDIDSPGTVTSKLVDPPIQKSLSIEVCKNSYFGETSFGDFASSAKENLAIALNEIDMRTCQINDRDLQPHANNIAPGIERTSVYDKKEDNICGIILAANKQSANRASELLPKLLPSCDYIHTNRVCCSLADSTVQDKFLKRKRFLKFKERVLSLKFQALHHFWKEDFRLISLRNHRTKPEKLNLGSRSLKIGSHKHRSSIRSRYASPAGNLNLVSMMEISSFTGKLLSDSQVKVYRNNLKMPAMILGDKEKVSRFVSSNGLVEDPCAVEKERSLINPWTSEEKDVFMANLAIHGKDFRKIASFLDHKTTADCVEFYYKNHKSECFKKFKKLEVKKQGKPLASSTYLVTSDKKWSREMNAASLDILGTASVIAAEADQSLKTSTMLLGKSSNKNRGSDGIIEASSSFNGAEDERETAAADVLAGICGSLSSEAMSSCITSSVDPGEGNPDWKHQKVGSFVMRPLTPEVTQNLDDGSCSDESCGEMDPTDWTDDEKSLFVQAFLSHGKDFLMISRSLGTKSRDQCKVFFSKARKCLGLDTLDQHRSAGINVSYNTNGRGDGDTEDVGIVETGSVVCSDKSVSGLNDVLNISQDVSEPEAQNCWPKQLDSVDADMVDVSDPNDCNGVVQDLEKDLASAVNASRYEDVKYKIDSATDVSVAQDAPHVSGLAMFREAGFGSGSKSQVQPYSTPVDFASYGGQFSKLSLTRDHASSGLSDESSWSSKGFPLDLSIKAELHDVVTHSVGTESIVDHTFQGSFLRKCNRIISPQNFVPDLPCLRRSEGDAGSQSSKIEKSSCANGDVKLFGKILSKSSSVDRPNSEEKAKHHSSSGGKFDMKLAAKQDSKGNPTFFSDDHNGFLGLENVPIRSYGFWDGTKIQTGFTSLPDSALLLAKYPGAFANYAISSPKSQQHPLQATTVNSNECNMNGTCVFSPREFSSSNGGGSCVDYTVLRNQEGGLQPFRLDMKQRPPDATFPELTQTNGFEPVASLPREGKGLVKLNVIKGGDVIGVSSSCTTTSDPVAALKFHYASQQFSNGGSGHAVNGILREDSWQSQGEVRR